MGTNTVFAISGEMGAGKTTFIQSICRELGVHQTVNSPSFAIINEYFNINSKPVYHFDLYRIQDPEELLDIGYEEYIYSGAYCFIEWPEKASDLIPADVMQIEIRILEDGARKIIIKNP